MRYVPVMICAALLAAPLAQAKLPPPTPEIAAQQARRTREDADAEGGLERAQDGVAERYRRGGAQAAGGVKSADPPKQYETGARHRGPGRRRSPERRGAFGAGEVIRRGAWSRQVVLGAQAPEPRVAPARSKRAAPRQFLRRGDAWRTSSRNDHQLALACAVVTTAIPCGWCTPCSNGNRVTRSSSLRKITPSRRYRATSGHRRTSTRPSSFMVGPAKMSKSLPSMQRSRTPRPPRSRKCFR